MNNARRNKVGKIIEALTKLQGLVNELQDEETDAYDSLTERQQESEKGDSMQEALEHLADAYNSLDEAIEALDYARD